MAGPPPTSTDDVCQIPEADMEMLIDFHDARVLLAKSMALLLVLGDPDVVDKITKRERKLMRDLAGKIKPYLEETSDEWNDEEEEDEPEPKAGAKGGK
jgi:hypothetical protein